MQFVKTVFPDVFLIEPETFPDERGYFLELYQERKFAGMGIPTHFVQENIAGSHQGVLRGLHYQIKNAQGKLVQAMAGEVFDAVVDLRKNSPHFGKWFGVFLSAENRRQIWVPGGFAHGYHVLSEWAEVLYRVTDFYSPEWERTLLWNDPEIGIDWHLAEGRLPILSPKDAEGKLLREAETY